jgi:hypothetical protein
MANVMTSVTCPKDVRRNCGDTQRNSQVPWWIHVSDACVGLTMTAGLVMAGLSWHRIKPGFLTTGGKP